MTVPFQSKFKSKKIESRVSQELTLEESFLLENHLKTKGYKSNLGFGSFGVAYELKDNIVVKLTSHQKEYENALIQNKYNFDNIVKIFNVSVLKQNVYLIITEKLDPLPYKLSCQYNKIYRNIDRLSLVDISKKFNIPYDFVLSVSDFLEKIKINKHFSNLISDAKSDNIGIKDKKLILLDLGSF